MSSLSLLSPLGPWVEREYCSIGTSHKCTIPATLPIFQVIDIHNPAQVEAGVLSI